MDDGVERTLGLMEGDDGRISGSNATRAVYTHTRG
jgi:hypothetical protein